MILPSPHYVNTGDTAWQMTAATLVGLMSIPGLLLLYGGSTAKKWVLQAAMMTLYAFGAVLVVWVMAGYSMGFGHPLDLGPGILHALIGVPKPMLSASTLQQRASIPLLRHLIPTLRIPESSLIYFQFVFAAIAPGIMVGALLGRVNFKAWILFVPCWSLCVYSVNAFMLWGGGWLSQLGAIDYSGGYVIHVAAGISGFVAAGVVGPRFRSDGAGERPPLILALAGAGLLWLGWNGFNGGDPYFANANAAAAILNTNIAAAIALMTWLGLDYRTNGTFSVTGSINGIICGLVAITPAAGYVNGYGALAIGALAAFIPWVSMRVTPRWRWFHNTDDALGIFHTHAVAGAVGGIMTGVLADPRMLEYLGGSSTVKGLIYGNPHLFLAQIAALLVIVLYDGSMTWLLLRLISRITPLTSSDPLILADVTSLSFVPDFSAETDMDDEPERHHRWQL